MAKLPTSGPIGFEQIRAAFNGPTPFKLSDYYRGGKYVPDIPENASIPTHGRIVFPHDFWGTGTDDAGGGTPPAT